MANLPPPPRASIVDRDGNPTRAFWDWMQRLVDRVGGIGTFTQLFISGNPTDGAVPKFSGEEGLVVSSGITVDDDGNVTTSGDVNGRDMAADGAQLDSNTATLTSVAETVDGLGTASQYDIGTSGEAVPLLHNENTWNNRQVFDVGDVVEAGLRIVCEENTNQTWSAVTIVRNEGTPADNNEIGRITFQGWNEAGANKTWGAIISQKADVTAGTEDGNLRFSTQSAGSFGVRMALEQGLVVGNPTGGDKGAGTINATAVYDDNVLLTCYVLEAANQGDIDIPKWDERAMRKAVRDLDTGAVRDIPQQHTAARAFRQRRQMMLDPKQYADRWKADGYLPSLPSPAEWAQGPIAVGGIVQRLWEAVECQAVHIEKLRQEIERLKILP